MIVEILDKAQTHIKTRVPAIKTCEVYAGQFDAEMVRKKAYASPGVFLACLGWRKTPEGKEEVAGDLNLDVRFAAFVVSKSPKGYVAASLEVTALAELVSQHVHKQTFGVESVGRARFERADNQFGLQMLKEGQALWPVFWWHTVGASSQLNPDIELFDFNEVCGGTDEQHTPGSIDIEIGAGVQP